MGRAQILDPAQDEQPEDEIQNEDFENQDPLEGISGEPQKDYSDLPEKYRGKSLEDVVRMHQEAERRLGEQGNEVGDLRKVVDEFIQSQTQQAPQREVEPEDELDYFTDPQAAVSRQIENHPSVRAAEEAAVEHRKQTAKAMLQSKHPDMQEILADKGFAEWIQASKIRTRLFVEADQNFDAEAADELFTLWKERKATVQQTVATEEKFRKQSVRAASNGGASGNPEGTGRKIYRRADIIKLMKNDPERYTAMADEIMAAYAEGRVK